MDHDEFLLQASKIVGQRQARQEGNREALINALPDYLKLAGGISATRHHDPVAVQLVKEKVSLEEYGKRAFGSATSSDFQMALAGSLSVLLAGSYASVSINGLLRNVEVPDFRPVAFPTLSATGPVLEIEDFGDPKPLRVVVPANSPTGGVKTYSAAFKLSRSVLFGLPEALSLHVRRVGIQLGNCEGKRLVEILESASLPDGALFNGTNSITSAPADVGGVAKAMSNLRQQLDGAGEMVGLSLGAIITPPALEGAFRKAKVDLGMGFDVRAMPWLSSSTTWYGLAPKTESSALVRLILRGTNGLPKIDYALIGEGESRSRAFVCSHDFEVSPTSRVGLVKATV